MVFINNKPIFQVSHTFVDQLYELSVYPYIVVLAFIRYQSQ